MLDPQAFDGRLGYRDRAGVLERRPQRVHILRGAQQIDTDVGPDRARSDTGARNVDDHMRVLIGRQRTGAGDRGRVGTHERQQPALERALVQLDVVADAEPPDHVEQPLERDALGVEQQLVAGGQDPQIAEHLALGRQERGVAAGAVGEPLDVVRHLALEEAARVRTRERELAALGAVD